MKFYVEHEINGRIRLRSSVHCRNANQADQLLFYFSEIKGVTRVKVFDRTGDVVIYYNCSRTSIIEAARKFNYDKEEIKALVPEYTGRELNQYYKEKLIGRLFGRFLSKLFLPYPIRTLYTIFLSMKYIIRGIKCILNKKLEVSVLDAAAIGVSILRKDYETARSIMFLLGIGDLLEEWTHKKTIDDLAQSMSLNIDKVWIKKDNTEVLTEISKVNEGDMILVHMGNMIPLDGIVNSGTAMVNQASLTGEPHPIRKEKDAYVYAGTVIEEGEILIQVKNVSGTTRYEKIVKMIEESEKLKSSTESRAEHLADALVPYSLAGSIFTYLVTGNITKAVSILMVDFSCALKLAMPIAVLSAMREASTNHITVKGGKYLEAVAEADTIVFDKTGTITKAEPTVAKIISFCDVNEDELLRIAACLEEHFPHSMANAVVNEAVRKGLTHNEMHSKVNYIVAHGISSSVDGNRVIIGSRHFVFEDEDCRVPEGKQELFDQLPAEYSHLYMAISDMLAAVICIEDPMREESKYVIKSLKELGINKVVMMTGDSLRTAENIAKRICADEFYAEVLPEDKANFVDYEKRQGKRIIMVGDGINDTPALSAADAGIAISEGAQIAREIADITITEDNLYGLVTLKQLSNGLMRRINFNYRFVIGFNLSLILLGFMGILTPSTSALLHNMSTLGISLKSMRNMLPNSPDSREVNMNKE